MKRVLELCLSPDLGGLELYMVRASHYLHALSVINKSGKLEEYYKNTEYKYAKIGPYSFITLARIIDENDIDIVHLHWTKDIPIAVMAKLLSRKKPQLVQTRNMRMTRFKDDFYHRFLYKNMSMILAVTHQVKEQIEKFIPADIRPKTEVLYMGAEVPVQLSAEDKREFRKRIGLNDEFVVGIVGRIEEAKGQHLVLQAVERLRVEGIDIKALIVGHTMDEGYLQILQSTHYDSGVFTGFTKEVQKYMQICDCLVLATKNETFGLVLIEAMMCGVCVVASDSGGPLEIIDDGINGLHFKTLDVVDLADKLESLARDVQKRNTFGKAGQQKAMDVFEAGKQFSKLAELLEGRA